MSLIKKIMAVCLVVICAVAFFGCGDENVGKADETATTTASVSAADEVVTTSDVSSTLSDTERVSAESESTESGEELIVPDNDNGNTVEIMTLPQTESAEGEGVDEAETSVAEAVTEVNSEPADETQPETAIELPFIPAQ